MEVSNCKSDAHLVYPRKMTFTTQPLVLHLKRMILIIHTDSSMIPCPPNLNSLSFFQSTCDTCSRRSASRLRSPDLEGVCSDSVPFPSAFSYYHRHICSYVQLLLCSLPNIPSVVPLTLCPLFSPLPFVLTPIFCSDIYYLCRS